MYSNLPLEVQRIVSDNDIWWSHGQLTTIKQFLSQYSLHDSTINSIQFQQNGACYLSVQLDAIHIDPNKKKLELPISISEANNSRPIYTEDPYLCISFSDVHQILSDHSEKYVVDNIIGFASTKMITTEQRELLLRTFLQLEDIVGKDTADFLLRDNLQCTIIEGVSGNHVRLIHNDPIVILCVRNDGVVIQLPDLELQES